jgi:hypothetical protein
MITALIGHPGVGKTALLKRPEILFSRRASAVVHCYLSCGRRDEGKGRIRITRRGRIAGSRLDKRLAENAPHAKTKFKLTPIFD